ncbi:MAG: Peptide deformylase [Dehalococcoidia bacterium]|nr:Peptide deformylase [Chloroflexota bacterium]
MTSSLRDSLTKWDSPLLKLIAAPVVFCEDGRVPALVEEFIRTEMMKDWAAASLYAICAPLLGRSLSVILIVAETPILMLNPRIVAQSTEMLEAEEFAPNIPVSTIKVTRPLWIRVRYSDLNEQQVTQRFEGVTARLVHQQLEYLNGVTPLHHAKYIRRNSIIKALKRAEKHHHTNNNQKRA